MKFVLYATLKNECNTGDSVVERGYMFLSLGA